MVLVNGGTDWCNMSDHSGEKEMIHHVTEFSSSSLFFYFSGWAKDVICMNCILKNFYNAVLK